MEQRRARLHVGALAAGAAAAGAITLVAVQAAGGYSPGDGPADRHSPPRDRGGDRPRRAGRPVRPPDRGRAPADRLRRGRLPAGRPADRDRPPGGRPGRRDPRQLPDRAPAAREDRHGPRARAARRPHPRSPTARPPPRPRTTCPEPLLTVARLANAVFGVASAVLLALVSARSAGCSSPSTPGPSSTRARSCSRRSRRSSRCCRSCARRERGGRTLRAPEARLAGRRRRRVRAGLREQVPVRRRGARDRRRLAVADAARRPDPTAAAGRPGASARWLAPIGGWLASARSRSSPRIPTCGPTRSAASRHRSPTTAATRRATRSRTRAGRSWQPLVWLMGSVPFHDAGTFLGHAGPRDHRPRARRAAAAVARAAGVRAVARDRARVPARLADEVAAVRARRCRRRCRSPPGLGAGSLLLRPVARPWLRAARDPRRDPSGPVARASAGSLRDLRLALAVAPPGIVGLVLLAVDPARLRGDACRSRTCSSRHLRDGLTGGVMREASAALAGQIPAVPFDFGQASQRGRLRRRATCSPGSSRAFWLGGNTSAASSPSRSSGWSWRWASRPSLGIAVALVLERPGVRWFANAWRILFILPWAIPEVVGRDRVAGHRPPAAGPARAARRGRRCRGRTARSCRCVVLLLAATWMGWPLWMLVATAGLRTIPRSVHEAAELEGAARWRRFAQRDAAAAAAPARRPRSSSGASPTFNQFYLFWVMGPNVHDDDGVDVQLLAVPAPSPCLFSVSAAVNIVTRRRAGRRRRLVPALARARRAGGVRVRPHATADPPATSPARRSSSLVGAFVLAADLGAGH